MRSLAVRSRLGALLLLSALVRAPLAVAQSAAEPSPPSRVVDAGAGLGDSAELAKVVGLYEGGRYGECAEQLGALLNPEGTRPLRDSDVIESARIYQAACLIGAGKPELADAPLAAAIRLNPQLKPPDSLVFPPAVVERFLRVRESLFREIRKAEDERVERARKQAELQEGRARAERERVRELERRAQEELVITKNRRYIAFVPFGVGQFQNGDTSLGWVFLTSEVLLGATALTTLAVESHLVLEANRLEASGNKPDPSINTRTTNWMTAFKYASYAWLGVALAGVVEAQLSFVPETRELRRRPLPERLVAPKAASLELGASGFATRDGVWLGLSGRF